MKSGRNFLRRWIKRRTCFDLSSNPIAGALIERKKFSIAVHYRLVDPDDVSRVEEAVTRVMGRLPRSPALGRQEGL